MTTYLAIHVALGLVAWGLMGEKTSKRSYSYFIGAFVACIMLGPIILGAELHERLPPRKP